MRGLSMLQPSTKPKKPLLALMGALIVVQLMMVGGDDSMVKIIGKEFANAAGEHWVYFSPYLGAIGAFFSGSNTVSNLTFGPIQQQIALDTGLSVTLILALQSVGGAMGNMVCINKYHRRVQRVERKQRRRRHHQENCDPDEHLRHHRRDCGCNFLLLNRFISKAV